MSDTLGFDRAPKWVTPVMRFGYAARGVTYVILGVLTFLAAWTGGNAEGTSSALASLRSTTWGVPLLWVIAVGLLAYAAWRFIAAWQDLELHGGGAKGMIARTGLFVTGLIHLGLAVTAARQAMGSSGSGEDGGQVRTLVSWLMQQDQWGKWVVVALGAITIGAGIYYGVKALREMYKKHMRQSPRSQKLDPVIKAGLIAHGIVVAIIGVFLIIAGLNADPSQAGGLNQAFEAVRAQPFGQILLGLLGIGLIAFAVYCFVESRYRIVPRRAGPDTKTLAGRFDTTFRSAIARVT
ncbi:DUF1206 domain-containing protein [Maritimibacter sp. UBA3975]|uniref:DUF1206 domain-containing protein n=1 Tax=Maritimibacter sp. UBA3975 TaxID=1946833 RepID=UPI000C09F201|nr:DUF1206 domain-containing protein [Maritimibacter sp. UBA3975]MAM62548.1 hypothetical protein [Maritimibacter sp.]